MPDLERLVAIDAEATAFPWSKAKFIESITPSAPCFLLEERGVIVAFAVFSQVLDEASLLNIAVLPAQQGKGYGKVLLEYSLAFIAKSAANCFLEVRASNQAAIQLYRHCGFETVGERRNYYPATQGREHALVMRLLFTQQQVD